MLRGRAKFRAPRRNVNLPPYDIEADISAVCSSVREILAEQDTKLAFEELYRNTYRIVLKKKSEILHDRVRDVLEEWLSEEVKPDVTRLASACDETGTPPDIGISISNETRLASQNFLVELKRLWGRYDTIVSILSDLFMYMDRVRADSGKGSIFSSFKECFRNCILQVRLNNQREHDITVQEILKEIILKQMELDRNGDIIDRRLIKSCVDIFLDISESAAETKGDSFYISALESDFLQTSREFYRAERSAWLRVSTASAYLRHIEKRVLEEQNRCRSTMPESTTVKILKVLGEELALIQR